MDVYNDFNTSVTKSLSEIDPNWESYEGLIIAGTHQPNNWQEQLELLKDARESGRPTLGICFGYQLMAIEYARNVLGHPNATSEELEEEGDFVVVKLPKLQVGLHKGESYWNNYALVDGFAEQMERMFTSSYFGVQFHPEYQSIIDRPHPVLIKFLESCSGNVE